MQLPLATIHKICKQEPAKVIPNPHIYTQKSLQHRTLAEIDIQNSRVKIPILCSKSLLNQSETTTPVPTGRKNPRSIHSAGKSLHKCPVEIETFKNTDKTFINTPGLRINGNQRDRKQTCSATKK